MFCPAAKMSLMIDIVEISSIKRLSHFLIDHLCLSPSGFSKSATEGLDKTHQEPTQTWPQLQLQTHPAWLQECWQWQVRVCGCWCEFVCDGLARMSGFFLLIIQVTVDFCVVAVSVWWKPSVPLFLTVVLHDDSPICCHVMLYWFSPELQCLTHIFAKGYSTVAVFHLFLIVGAARTVWTRIAVALFSDEKTCCNRLLISFFRLIISLCLHGQLLLIRGQLWTSNPICWANMLTRPHNNKGLEHILYTVLAYRKQS